MSYRDSFELTQDAKLYEAKSAELNELIETVKDNKAKESLQDELITILEKHLCTLEAILRGLKK